MSRALVLALLTVFPHFPARRTIAERLDAIAATADAASVAHSVPPHILISVGFHETHLGIDEPDWGAPISRARRHTAGNADDAARVLARSYAICRTWRGAVARFRSGLCEPPEFARSYVASVLRLARRISAHARREERRALALEASRRSADPGSSAAPDAAPVAEPVAVPVAESSEAPSAAPTIAAR